MTSFDSLEIEKLPTLEEPIKHKVLYAGFVVTTILAPYIGGAVILFNEKKLTEWNWI